ncbi:Pleckstrin-likey domain-containing family D member 1 [Hondaea fermentalgiana]|uniref:Pleckstrin-likey domain-containing family D member 1 n=1 Tax=Hondaea fermentalgiana TaxID=2315210 RepID=A0A2R5H2E9_9STRA|nr:Pleckstrin-likey domain-containing family D member 1 [Hondaea fermentalgiana]|eukprot:GBG35011.1 Pleckstrin-likey domain-containing family D member 1 [Hondaea fermentalgiana]
MAAMTKADKLLGLDENGLEHHILVQKEGPLQRMDMSMRMPFYKRVHAVVKESFLLFYKSKNESAGPWDSKPTCVIPLNGATVSLDVRDRRLISVSNIDSNANFRVKAENPGEAMDWLVAFQQAKRATLENAMLGAALIEKMQAEGSQLEAEKEQAFQEMQERAARLDREQQQREEARLRDQQRADAFQAKLSAERSRVTVLEGTRTDLTGRVSKEEAERRKAVAKRMSVERKLAQAEQALEKLEAAMIVRNGAAPQASFQREDSEVRASVSALRRFFEARAKEQAVRAKALYERMV